MEYKALPYIVHGGDYNPDQWVNHKEIWDEDMRLMKLSHVNSATVGIFSWSLLEPKEGEYNFGWLDEILDKLHSNGVGAILPTLSGARPAWLAQKYPEVLRVQPDGVRNEFGVRHNHCMTSPVYREKVRALNEKMALRYKDHPALTMWHISNEYSGECHCALCQQAFREWLKEEYHNDLDALNEKWWNGFWAHRFTDWSQIVSPKYRSDLEVPALRLAWRRFVSDSHLSFYLNEISPLRELTPGVPITTNFMRMYDGIDYQKFAKYVDVVSWDNYPAWEKGDNLGQAMETAFVHDAFRSMKGGQPFYMMESTPSIVNWQPVNKLPRPGLSTLSAVQAVAHGADSVQYFQWRKSRGGHEKYHGAVVDHVGHEHTRVFRDVTRTGETLEKLSAVAGVGGRSRVAVLYDWENDWAVKTFCGFNNERRDYFAECKKWYRPFWERGIAVDVISMDDDFGCYDCVLAPFLYMLKNGVEEKIEAYVKNGGVFLGTYLTAMVDRDDLCYLGGVPAGKLKDVFGVWHEDTDALPADRPGKASFRNKTYTVDHVCDLLHLRGATALGTYQSDFYAGTPAVTENAYGKGTAYYVAFRNDADLAEDVSALLIKKCALQGDAPFRTEGLSVRRRGDMLFLMNFTDEAKTVLLPEEFREITTETTLSGEATVPPCSFLILQGTGAATV